MFLLSIYFYLFILNFGALYISSSLGGLNPFFLVYGVYLFTAIALVSIQTFRKYSQHSQMTIQLAERMIANGKNIFFITGLTLFDLLILLLVIPDASVVVLEEAGFSLIIFSLLFLFTPIFLLKFTVENHASKFEVEFWQEFKIILVKDNKLSPMLVSFILSRLQAQSLQRTQSSSLQRDESLSTVSDDEIVTTAYPASKFDKTENIDLLQDKRNPVFDSEEQLATDNPIKKYSDELLNFFPHLNKFIDAKPVNIRAELLLNIIINNSARDPQIYQQLQKLNV